MLKTALNVTPKPGNEIKIHRLLNSIYYFIDLIFIFPEGDRYRLAAIHHGRVYYDTIYESLRGAKIAFTKLFAERAWDEKVQAAWSHGYHPDQDWYEEQMKVLSNHKEHVKK